MRNIEIQFCETTPFTGYIFSAISYLVVMIIVHTEDFIICLDMGSECCFLSPYLALHICFPVWLKCPLRK